MNWVLESKLKIEKKVGTQLVTKRNYKNKLVCKFEKKKKKKKRRKIVEEDWLEEAKIKMEFIRLGEMGD